MDNDMDMSAEDLLAVAKGRLSMSPAKKKDDEKKEAAQSDSEPAEPGNKNQASHDKANGETFLEADDSFNVETLETMAIGEPKDDSNPKDKKDDDAQGEGNDNGGDTRSVASEDEESDSSSDGEEEEKEDDVNDLLAAVKGRMEQQKLMDEISQLRKQLQAKDQEITKLNGQVQMAISTKQSLLIANSELEQQQENYLEMSKNFEEDLRIAGQVSMDMRAEIEKDFLNDLTKMADRLAKSQETISQKEDRICHLEAQLTNKQAAEQHNMCTACQEKTQTIRDLQAKVHKLEKLVPRQETSKVQFYKAKLGL